MQQLELILKNEKLKFYNKFSLFIIVILTLLYLNIGFFTGNNSSQWNKMATLYLMCLVLIIFFISKTEYNKSILIFSLLLVIGWVFLKQYWLAGITLLFEFLFVAATKKKEIIFSSEKIVYPSFPSKTIKWGELNNLILKDGLLTIDFKNNKIIQQLIDEVNTINEKEFNDFCRQQLATSNQKPAT